MYKSQFHHTGLHSIWQCPYFKKSLFNLIFERPIASILNCFFLFLIWFARTWVKAQGQQCSFPEFYHFLSKRIVDIVGTLQKSQLKTQIRKEFCSAKTFQLRFSFETNVHFQSSNLDLSLHILRHVYWIPSKTTGVMYLDDKESSWVELIWSYQHKGFGIYWLRQEICVIWWERMEWCLNPNDSLQRHGILPALKLCQNPSNIMQIVA